MSAAVSHSQPPASADSSPICHPLFSQIRLAVPSDMPHIHKLIHEIAVYEPLTHLFPATNLLSPPISSPLHRYNPSPMVESEVPVNHPERKFSNRKMKTLLLDLFCFSPIFQPYWESLGLMLLEEGFGENVAVTSGESGICQVEWVVLEKNVTAIKFYEEMGTQILPEWRVCDLTGNLVKFCK